VELVQHFLETKRQNVFDAMMKSEITHRCTISNPLEEQTPGGYGGFRTKRGLLLHAAISLHLDEMAPLVSTWPTAVALLAGTLSRL
jgi:hypothetical protein